MNRRQVLLRLAGVVGALCFAVPPVAEAQKTWRVGYLTFDAADAANLTRIAFRERLRGLGYIEGRNVTLEMRAAEGDDVDSHRHGRGQ